MKYFSGQTWMLLCEISQVWKYQQSAQTAWEWHRSGPCTGALAPSVWEQLTGFSGASSLLWTSKGILSRFECPRHTFLELTCLWGWTRTRLTMVSGHHGAFCLLISRSESSWTTVFCTSCKPERFTFRSGPEHPATWRPASSSTGLVPAGGLPAQSSELEDKQKTRWKVWDEPEDNKYVILVSAVSRVSWLFEVSVHGSSGGLFSLPDPFKPNPTSLSLHNPQFVYYRTSPGNWMLSNRGIPLLASKF